MIPITKSFLPPLDEYMGQVKRAYDNEWLTNRGELVIELEQSLTDYLGLRKSKILCMNNGTIPMQIALKILGNGGEIITTPFSYIATTAAIMWENCTPVFVDIDAEYLTIDEAKIEAAITENTTCILATHVFGNPCNIDAIGLIAKKHDLKVIYDAAHCFGVEYKGRSIFEYGDLSTCSFHATKLFHTGEGGAVFCKDSELYHQIFYSHNFGHNGQTDFYGLGINGKISELQSAMGLAVLPYMGHIVSERRKVVDYYTSNLNFKSLSAIKLRGNTNWNYSYYPVIFESEELLIKVLKLLNENSIFPRRYFYPSLDTISFIKGNVMPISKNIASRILCLPLFVGLDKKELEKMVNHINCAIC